METPDWIKKHPLISGTVSCLVLVGSLWALFTEKAVVPTVAGWFGVIIPQAGIPWPPLIGSLLALFLLVTIWMQVKAGNQSTVSVVESKPQEEPKVYFGPPFKGQIWIGTGSYRGGISPSGLK